MRFFLVILIIFSAQAQDYSASDFETSEAKTARLKKTIQTAIFAYPEPKKIKKGVDRKVKSYLLSNPYIPHEVVVFLGATYTVYRNQEISTKPIKNMNLPLFGGTVRPDLGYQIERQNGYCGFFFTKEIQ